MEILTNDHGPTDSNLSYRRSPSIYHIAHTGPLHFPNTPLSAVSQLLIGVKSLLTISRTVIDCLVVVQDPSKTLSQSLGAYCPMFRFRRRSLPRIQEWEIIVLIIRLALVR